MRIFQVDAFADRPFAGNPAAVCLFSGAPDDAWKQGVAREMNLAATAFVERDAEGFSFAKGLREGAALQAEQAKRKHHLCQWVPICANPCVPDRALSSAFARFGR
jgi:hypothetical protein